MTRFAPLLLALAGLILFGHGAYIHAKAFVAQILWSAPSPRRSSPHR